MKEKIIFILLNLGAGRFLIWLSILFIDKVYLRIKPKDIDEKTRARRENIFFSICIPVALILIFIMRVMLIADGEGKITWIGFLINDIVGAILISLTILPLRIPRVQKWLHIK